MHVFTHHVVSETDTRLSPDPLIDVIFMSSKDSRKRMMHFFTFSCVKKHPVSVHTASGSLPVHTFSSFYCLLVLFFTSVILNPLFPRPRDSGDGVCEGCV